MKNLILYISILVFSIQVSATNISVSDSITTNTLWTGIDTVNVVGDIFVVNETTLTIDSGIVVLFHGHYKIKVIGRILALGTTNARIKFTALDQNTGWNGLLLNVQTYSGNDPSHINFCDFEYGNANTNDHEDGGCVYCTNYCTVSFSDCNFTNNSASGKGGAIMCESSTVNIKRCVFSNNTANDGGAIYFKWAEYPTVYNSLFHSNNADNHAGAVYFYTTSGSNQFYNNTATNNSTNDNQTGGAFTFDDGAVEFKNNIVYGNQDVWESNQIEILSDFISPKIEYCDIEGGLSGFTGIGFQGTYENNIDEDPGFVGSGDYPYNITLSSPCANSGCTSYAQQTGLIDLKGDKRCMLAAADIGAYEVAANVDNFCGTALKFDDTLTYATVANDELIDLIDDFTIEAWIKPNSFCWLGGIVSKYQDAGKKGFTLRLSHIEPYTGIEFNEQYTANGLLDADNWYHIAAVRQSGVNHIYINGEEKGLSGTGYTVEHHNTPLTIGVDYLKSPRYFDGQIDEVRIWNYARSQEQIDQSMNISLSGTEFGLSAYWQFNDSIGVDAEDIAGTNYATLMNMSDNNWLNSTIAFGKGKSNSQTVSSPGIIVFDETSVSMDFSEKTGSDIIVVSRIDTVPNILPEECETAFGSQYWMISKIGDGNLKTDLSFTLNENIDINDQNNPHQISLYRREINSGSQWLRWKSASSVSGSSNTVTFNNIDEFGQFMIGRYLDTIPPVISTIYPESWAIIQDCDSLSITFDESVNMVDGKSITIYNTSDSTIAHAFTFPSPSISGDESETIIINLDPSLAVGDYYILIDEGAFTDAAGNPFAGINDSEKWKITVLDVDGLLFGDVTWTNSISVYSDILIDDILNIASGTTIKLMDYVIIENQGYLYAEGTENDSINFFALDTVTGWQGIMMGQHSGNITYCNIKNGNGIYDNNLRGFGGAIYVGQATSPTYIEHNTFSHNRADMVGGAIYCNSNNAFIQNNIFKNNSANNGGALAIEPYVSTANIKNNLFVGNHAVNQGGALFVNQVSISYFYNNTFTENRATFGGAVACTYGSNPIFYNCIFYNNQANTAGNQITIDNTSFGWSAPEFHYCLLQGGPNSINGDFTGVYEHCIDENPLFILEGEQAYALQKSSLCMNAGDPTFTAYEVGNTDLAGGPRFLHGCIDIGAYEIQMTPDGYAGNALQFNGIDEYASIGDNNSLDITENVTIEAWIRASSWEDYIWKGSIVAKDGSNKTGYNLRCGENGRLSFVSGISGQWVEVQSQEIMETDTWYHVCGTYDGNSQKLYINGDLVGENQTTGFIDTNDVHLFIAASPGFSDRYFNGKIDEIRLWNTARTEQQIRENMYLTVPEDEDGLVSYWQFNLQSGNIIADLVGINRGKIHNANDDMWVPSTVPIGNGTSNTKIVDSEGLETFDQTGISLNFYHKTTTDTLVISRIDTLPNITPLGGETEISNKYWIIDKFGDGDFYTQMQVEFDEDLTEYDQLNPYQIQLWNRESNSDSTWQFVKRASSVDAAENTTYFDSINNFGQFLVTKNELDYYPGYALRYDTSGGHLSLANENKFDFDTAFTIETWVNIDSMSVDYHTILSKGNAWQLRLVYDDDEIMIEFSINMGDQKLSAFYFTDTATMLKKWNHISCVYKNTGSDSFMKLYLNGTEGSPNMSAALVQNNTPVVVSDNFKGILDELRFWQTARSTQEIRESMHLSLHYPMDGLVSYLQLNEGNGAIAKDVFGGNYGTITMDYSPAWCESSVPFGGGTSNTQIEQSGVLNFGDTDVSLNFSTQNAAEITVSKIEVDPNINPPEDNDVFDNQYWAIHRYGEGNFNADISFTVNEQLTENDVAFPGQIKLFTRSVNSSEEWTLVDSATSVNTDNNVITFTNISEFGQFIIGRHKNFSSKPGHSLHFDGQDDYLSGSGIDTNLINFTMEAWVKHDSLNQEIQKYITLEPEVATLFYDGSIYGGYGQLCFSLKKESGHKVTIRVDSVLQAGEWSHIAGSYNGTTMKLYLNGELLSSRIQETNLYPLNGEFSISDENNPMYGEMDEIRIWDSERSLSQLRESRHNIFTESEKNLIHYWQLNEGTGMSARDTVGGLIGTLNNMGATNWDLSTIPAGVSDINTQLVDATGPYQFGNTNLNMNFTVKQGNDSIVVSKINLSPNAGLQTPNQAFDSQYWIVDNYGSGNFTTDIGVSLNEELTVYDEIYPHSIKLFRRASNSDSAWILSDSATSINADENIANFSGINQFGQFMVARGINTQEAPSNCLTFDGINDYVSVDADSSLNLDTFTVEFWIKTSNPSTKAGVIDKGKSSLSDFYFLSGDTGNTEGVIFGIGDGTSTVNEIAYSWNDENWHHVAGTYDGDTMKLFVDGLIVETKTVSINKTTNAIRFGSQIDSTSFFNGKLEEIRIWNIAHDINQIRFNMHKQVIGDELNLVGYWCFNENTGGTAHDLSGNHSGTLVNMNENSWTFSSAPLPYFTVDDGYWETDNTWAEGQSAPTKHWSRVLIKNNISLNMDLQLLELKMSTGVQLKIITGSKLIITDYLEN